MYPDGIGRYGFPAGTNAASEDGWCVALGGGGLALYPVDSLLIKNFRTFAFLDVGRLGRVNLIVGKNNVGKSTLLDAVRLYSERNYPQLLFNLVDSRRIPHRTLFNLRDVDSPVLGPITSLFHGYDVPLVNRTPITIGSLDEGHTVTLRVTSYKREEQADQLSLLDEVSDQDEGPDGRPALTVSVDGNDVDRVWLDEPIRRLRSRVRFTKDLTLGAGVVSTHVPPSGVTSEQLGTWWDAIALTPMEAVILDGLKILEPDIEGVSFLGFDRTFGQRSAVVRLKNYVRPVPLSSLGDGTNRILGIGLALVNAANGVTTIDEIENGIHYSIQSALWKLVSFIAKTMNIQVFATSHSWDSIEAFQRAAGDDPEVDGILVRLARSGDSVTATIFDEHDLTIIARDRIEVR